jgi:hypothetical protein
MAKARLSHFTDFRKNSLAELKSLFAQMVKICDRLGMVSSGHIAAEVTHPPCDMKQSA